MQKTKSNLYVDLRITGLCDMNCNFCHGAPRGMRGVDLNLFKKTIDKLAKIGISALTISGGEPLIRKDTSEIIAYAYKKGLDVYLSTNGMRLLKYYNKISHYLKWIGLPLDGSTPIMNKKMSRDGHLFNNTIQLLRFFKKHPPKSKIKVGTVVSKINKNDIINIGKILFDRKDLYQPAVWRLYQFSPRGEGLKTRKIHEISDRDFKKLCQVVIARFPNKNIVPLSNDDHNDSYIFIDPDLSIVTARDERFVYLGNINDISVKDLADFKKKFSNIIIRGSHNRVWLESDK